MKKFRSHVGLIAIAASLSLLGACSDKDKDEVVDSGAATEASGTTPPASTEAPAPAAPATTPSTADSAAGTTDSGSMSSTPDSGTSGTSGDVAPATGTQ